MFEIGDYLIYRRQGVCKLESIETPKSLQHTGKQYYKLRPAFSDNRETIYIPVDAGVHMRPVVSDEEAMRYLELAEELQPEVFWSSHTALLTQHYQELLSTYEIKDYLTLIKEVCLKEREALKKGRKLGQVDTRFLTTAGKLVCEEFAVALNTSPEQVRERLEQAMLAGLS